MKTADNRGNEVIAMITRLVTRGNSFKLLSSIVDIVVKEDGINKTGKRKTCTRPLQSR
jgi:hypothetical protein